MWPSAVWNRLSFPFMLYRSEFHLAHPQTITPAFLGLVHASFPAFARSFSRTLFSVSLLDAALSCTLSADQVSFPFNEWVKSTSMFWGTTCWARPFHTASCHATYTYVGAHTHVCYMHYDTDAHVCKVFHYGIFCAILASCTRILVNLFWHDEGSVFFQRFACCWYLPITAQHAETDNAEYQILQED